MANVLWCVRGGGGPREAGWREKEENRVQAARGHTGCGLTQECGHVCRPRS